MPTLAFLILAVSIACGVYLLIARIARWHEDVMWRDGYRFAKSKLGEGQIIMPHERGSGAFALGVVAAETERCNWRTAENPPQNSPERAA